jgi:RNA polymerase sigma-70 factor (ECF subfamily)
MPEPAVPIPASDPELVARHLAGEERAATELMGRHAPAVARFLYSAGADRDDLDDLVQETFFRAFHRLGSWRQEAGFRSWLFTIASNQLKDAVRRRKGVRILPLEAWDAAGSEPPDRIVEADETAERLREGIAALPRLQREVFLRRVQSGEEYGAIAAALGTTAGAARVHYHHAVKRLKELAR